MMETIEQNKWNELLAFAKNGDADAQWEVGYYHEYGAADEIGLVLTHSNPSEAIRWYTLSAVSGNAAAQCALSNLFSVGENVARDVKQAIFWAKKAIAQGGASAAFNIGTIYRDMKKPAMAFRYYQRAVSMGDDDALLHIGLCHMFGFGVPQDLAAASNSFSEIISKQSSAMCQRTKENALYWMALLHLLGSGPVKKSVPRARTMLELANAYEDHEQTNEILNLIGKTRFLSA